MTDVEFAEAYQKGMTRTVRFLMSRGVNPDTASEVAQDAWGKGWMKRESLLDRKAIVPWVNSIALNMFRVLIKKQPVDCDVPEQAVHPTTTPEAADVTRILQSCGLEDRALLKATARGFTSKDLAAIMGCKPSTIRVRLMRLRRRLAVQTST